MGSSVLITVAHHEVPPLLDHAVHLRGPITGQTDSPKPDIDNLGCPALPEPLDCFARGTTCIHEDRTNIYKTVRARSWWHCGKACLPATKCEYWTFRHHQRKCYLLKSCCKRAEQGFQSGDQYCPGYEDA